MDSILSVISVAALAIGCIGYGALILTATQADQYVDDAAQRLALSFVLGFGFFGWVLFFPGMFGLFGPVLFWFAAGIGVLLLFLRRTSVSGLRLPSEFSALEVGLLSMLALVLGFDLLEGISPPADADSLAYHFALPRDFLAAGQIEFVARAISGAIPMLIHMTYAAALATGGELALTLWVMLSGWAAGFVLYAFIRPYFSRVWAMGVLIAFLTTPAILYGGGNGQVEIRCAAFVLASVFLLIRARRENAMNLYALSGLCAGFFIGAKFFGLVFAGTVGLIVLIGRSWFRRAIIFSAAAVFAGFQWYLWNWLHTGDPVFPILTNLLQFPDSALWTPEFGAYFSAFMDRGELPLDRSLLNWFLYPVYATFNLIPEIEGGRTGLGVFVLLLLPLAVAALFRPEFRRSEFTIPLLVVFIFYTIWFFSGTAQRVRHLLPIYPLLLFSACALAAAYAQRIRVAAPLAVGVGAALVLQLGGHAVFSYNYARYVLTAETRNEFWVRNVPGFTSADWINRNLPDGSKIAFMKRQLSYPIERPGFSMHPNIQAVVEARPEVGDVRRFIGQLRDQHITHLLLPISIYDPVDPSDKSKPFNRMIRRMIVAGCLSEIAVIETVRIRSRTLSQFGGRVSNTKDAVFAISRDECRV